MATHRIAVIPGDGIGKEVMPEGIRVLEAVGRKFELSFRWDHFSWSCEHYLVEGRMMSEDGLVGQIWAGALMLDHLGHPEASEAVLAAIEEVLAFGPRTPDMGGAARTEDVGKAIADAI